MSRIKELREAKKLTQAELAKLLNVSQVTISKWDQGKTNPDIQLGIELSRIFEVSLDVIYNNPYAPTAPKFYNLSLPEQRILDLLDKVREEPDKYEIIGAVRQIAEKMTYKSVAYKYNND